MSSPGPTMRQLVEGMAVGFDPGSPEAGVVEFTFTGDEPGTFQLVFGAGRCRFERGRTAPASVAIETTAATWRAIADRRLDAMAAVLDGRLSVRGDLALFQRLRTLFRPVTPAELRAAPEQRAPGPVRLPAMAWLFVALLPWKLFWVLSALHAGRAALVAACVVALVVMTAREAAGGSTFFERGSALAFGAAAVASFASAPGSTPPLVPASFLALAALWAASVLHAERPVTAEYARWAYRPVLWDTTLFRHPNAVLTLLWSGTFAALGLLAAIGARRWIPGAATGALGLALCVVMGIFTRHRERHARECRVADIDRSLASLAWMGRVSLVGIAAGLLLIGVPARPGPWLLVPAAACLVAALWRR